MKQCFGGCVQCVELQVTHIFVSSLHFYLFINYTSYNCQMITISIITLTHSLDCLTGDGSLRPPDVAIIAQLIYMILVS